METKTNLQRKRGVFPDCSQNTGYMAYNVWKIKNCNASLVKQLKEDLGGGFSSLNVGQITYLYHLLHKR